MLFKFFLTKYKGLQLVCQATWRRLNLSRWGRWATTNLNFFENSRILGEKSSLYEQPFHSRSSVTSVCSPFTPVVSS